MSSLKVEKALNYFHYNLIQTLPRFLLLPIIKTCLMWEGVQSEQSLGIHPNNCVHWSNSSILTSWKIMWKMCVHLPLTPTLTLLLFLPTWKFLEMNALGCGKPSIISKTMLKDRHEYGASIVATTLDFMVILNMLTCISKPLANKLDGQIIATSKDVFKSKSLTCSKRRLVQ